MNVIGRSVERDASENGGGLNLREKISTNQLVPNDARARFEYNWGGSGSFREIESADGGHF